jgi:hypothetical protein
MSHFATTRVFSVNIFEMGGKSFAPFQLIKKEFTEK